MWVRSTVRNSKQRSQARQVPAAGNVKRHSKPALPLLLRLRAAGVARRIERDHPASLRGNVDCLDDALLLQSLLARRMRLAVLPDTLRHVIDFEHELV